MTTVDTLSQPTAFYGGSHLSNACTASFVVRGIYGGEGFLTAGHCYNLQNWRGGTTAFYYDEYRDSFDVEYRGTPKVDDKARFYTGVGVNSVRSVQGRSNQFKGRIVCKYGKTIGFKCGTIVGREYAPTYVASANRTFMRVRRTGGNFNRGGDSGGPVFDGSTALGIVSGRTSQDYGLYMAINFAYSAPIGVDKVQTVN